MKKVALFAEADRKVLISRTAEKKRMNPAIVEKDFWVCFLLDHLFHDCQYKDAFVFKGGTSLSKAYQLIERFSEDIDLILDWRKIIGEESDPWEERSKTQQDMYNKRINKAAANFYRDSLVPVLNQELIEKLGDGTWVEVDNYDEMVVNFLYPKLYDAEYIVPAVRLEIGPLAEWMPSHERIVKSFAAEEYPNIFEQGATKILTIDAERTFWEKITILHKMANFPMNKDFPRRYARHIYDVYNLARNDIKQSAFRNKDLLEKDVLFKSKFYYARNAHYESATLAEIKLMPAEHILIALRKDYVAMRNMIYGDYPDFDEMLKCLSELETEIHNL